jgi:hypothetical protein
MSTAVTLRQGSAGPEVTLLLPSNERVTVQAALQQFRCGDVASTGVRLCLVVAAALERAYRKSPTAVTALYGLQMPLLSMKDRLFSLAGRCGACNGAGCLQCGHSGMAP